MGEQDTVRAGLRLPDAISMIKNGLGDVLGVLDVLVLELARGRRHPVLWNHLHEAAARDGMLAELAFAYERVTLREGFKSMSPFARVEVLMNAAVFFEDRLADYEGAFTYLDRLLSIVPTYQPARERLPPLLERHRQKATRTARTWPPRVRADRRISAGSNAASLH